MIETDNKQPFMPFFYGDWLRDARLRGASASSRGLWIDVLSFMWDDNREGEITRTFSQFYRMLACTKNEFSKFLIEAQTLGFCDIATKDNDLVTLINRRMKRAATKRLQSRNRQRKKRGLPLVTQESQPCTPSISVSYSNSDNTYSQTAQIILNFLNAETGKKFRNTKEIEARLKEGATEQEFHHIVLTKMKDPFFIANPKNINPVTLFRKIHWDTYLNETTEDYEPEAKPIIGQTICRDCKEPKDFLTDGICDQCRGKY